MITGLARTSLHGRSQKIIIIIIIIIIINLRAAIITKLTQLTTQNLSLKIFTSVVI